MSSINVIMRPASTVCNLSCYYCYNKLELLAQPNRFMKIDILEHVIRNFIHNGRKTIKFLWHGGEPMIVGLDFYRPAVEFQKTAMAQLSSPIIITNTNQTNGLLLDEEKVKFLISEKFNFGISIDGPDYVHNQNRYDRFGKGSHDKVMEKIEMLRRMRAKIGIVSVVTKKSLPYAEDIFDFFIGKGLTSMHFSPYVEMDRKTGLMDERSLTAEEFGYFIVKIFKAWKRLNNPEVKVRIIDNFLQGLLGGRMELCTFAGNCSHHLLVEVNGDIFICGRNANKQKFHVGNVVQTKISDVIASDAFQETSRQMQRVSEDCEKCKWLNVCKGGCSYYKLMFSDGLEPKTEYFCEGYKIILAEIENWLHAEGVISRGTSFKSSKKDNE